MKGCITPKRAPIVRTSFLLAVHVDIAKAGVRWMTYLSLVDIAAGGNSTVTTPQDSSQLKKTGCL